MKLFADTNVLASAFGTRGLCLDLVRLALEEHELVVSAPLLDELERVLAEKFGVPAQVRIVVREALAECTLAAAPESAPAFDCPDPSDAPLLAAALAAGAAFFITGDKALLEMGSVKNMLIVSPRQMYERLLQGV